MGDKSLIKICGVRERSIVDLCEELSVDFIGLNFSPKSPRKIGITKALELVVRRNEKGFPKIVALFFQNEARDIQSIVSVLKPDLVQLISEDPFVPNALWREFLQKKILLPAFRIQTPILSDLELEPSADLVIVDSYKKDMGGGTGHSFPWEYVKTVTRPYLLAGGIHANNVESALSQVNAQGVDVASGIETDGVADPNKIRMLVKNVRRT